MTRHLLDVTDLSPAEVHRIMNLAEMPTGRLGLPLTGRGAALVFEKPSNRTRHSMEMAVVQLGGHPVYTRGEEVGFDTREPVEDVARVMAGYHAVIAARVFDHRVLERIAAVVSDPVAYTAPEVGPPVGVSVLNLLSDHSHPMQALADILTMRQLLGDLEDRTVAWIGDYNNVARSLGQVSAMCGMHLRFACPPGYEAPDIELDQFTSLGAASVTQVHRPVDGAEGADVVHTDTWVSMGQEADKAERIRVFESYCVDHSVMEAAAAGAVFMHCLPAYRGLEVSAEVIDGPASAVLRQAHNRLHVARAALAFVLDPDHSGELT
jgi:ornithine carbamoyltransferase